MGQNQHQNNAIARAEENPNLTGKSNGKRKKKFTLKKKVHART
jgi:hypothetical protein